MLANPSIIRGGNRATKLVPEGCLQTNGWGNNMIEAYTGNHTGHRAFRKRLKVDIAP